jgi:hypothetical protein
VQVSDAKAAIREAVQLLSSPERRTAMGNAGRRLCEAHRGATRRHLDVVTELVRG